MRKPLITNKPESKVSAFDYSCAKVLANAVQKHLRKTPNYKAWSNEFRLLRNTYAKPRITKALAWYEYNVGKEYVPVAHSAKSFRAKFKAIESAMERSPTVQTTLISDQAKAIQKDLGLNWPLPSQKKDEAQFIQASLDSYQDFIQTLRKLSQSNKIAKILLQRYAYSTPTGITKAWVVIVHDFACRMSKIRKEVKLLRCVWSIHNRRIDQGLMDHVMVYTGNPKDWTTLKEAIRNM